MEEGKRVLWGWMGGFRERPAEKTRQRGPLHPIVIYVCVCVCANGGINAPPLNPTHTRTRTNKLPTHAPTPVQRLPQRTRRPLRIRKQCLRARARAKEGPTESESEFGLAFGLVGRLELEVAEGGRVVRGCF